jgi:phosphoserine phosphatase
VACGHQRPNSKATSLQQDGWASDNKNKLQQWLTSSVTSERRVAVFDWDNTMIKNDIGDAVMFWMLSHDLIKSPRNWKSTSKYLTPAALAALKSVCPYQTEYLATASNTACAETILQIYSDGKLKNGQAAWSEKYNHDTLEPAYAWAVHLAQGYSPEQLRALAAEVIQFNTSNPVGTTQTIGERQVDAWIRLYPQMQELVQVLQSHAYEVWVVSASMQYYVEAFAALAGIDSARVIGVRPKLSSAGKTTSLVQSCGSYRVDNQEIITYRQGKRCWINKVIFGMKNRAEQMNTPSPIVFGAGDSDTDFFFIKDAGQMRLAINRNKNQLMCHALANSDGRWLVNPMFIAPKTKKPEAYKCGAYGLPDQSE